MYPIIASKFFNGLVFISGFACFACIFAVFVYTFTESYIAVESAEIATPVEKAPEPEIVKRYVEPAEIELPFY